MIRNFLKQTRPHSMIANLGWRSVTMHRTVGDGVNVGVDSELDNREVVKHIQVRLDPMDKNLDSDEWVGLIKGQRDVRLGDVWVSESPDKNRQRFKVKSIRDNDIVLERM